MNSNLRTGDNVVVVEGVNIVHKHSKPRSQKDKGGIKKVEAAIDVSNVMIICPACGKPTRIAHKFDEKGNKHRACKKCGAFMDGVVVARAKKEAKKESSAKKVEKAETKEKAKSAPKKSATKATKPATANAAEKAASSTRRKAPVAKSQGK